MSDGSMADEKTPELRSPTETLVRCMEDFGESEPKKVLVIWTNTDGDLCWSESGPSHFCENIGILTCVKSRIMQKFLA
jgi:hypothetical protein